MCNPESLDQKFTSHKSNIDVLEPTSEISPDSQRISELYLNQLKYAHNGLNIVKMNNLPICWNLDTYCDNMYRNLVGTENFIKSLFELSGNQTNDIESMMKHITTAGLVT